MHGYRAHGIVTDGNPVYLLLCSTVEYDDDPSLPTFLVCVSPLCCDVKRSIVAAPNYTVVFGAPSIRHLMPQSTAVLIWVALTYEIRLAKWHNATQERLGGGGQTSSITCAKSNA